MLNIRRKPKAEAETAKPVQPISEREALLAESTRLAAHDLAVVNAEAAESEARGRLASIEGDHAAKLREWIGAGCEGPAPVLDEAAMEGTARAHRQALAVLRVQRESQAEAQRRQEAIAAQLTAIVEAERAERLAVAVAGIEADIAEADRLGGELVTLLSKIDGARRGLVVVAGTTPSLAGEAGNAAHRLSKIPRDGLRLAIDEAAALTAQVQTAARVLHGAEG